MIEAFRGEELEEKDTLTLTLSRRGRGKKSREVTNENGVHKGEFFPPYTGGYFPTSFFLLLSFIFFLRRRRYFFFSYFLGVIGGFPPIAGVIGGQRPPIVWSCYALDYDIIFLGIRR